MGRIISESVSQNYIGVQRDFFNVSDFSLVGLVVVDPWQTPSP
ncbi:hypothetical protein SBA2_50021 [Acidobacteriia bacterium SbA2]|nr:hypothetical protein SBA2_50021 [Acidobacteriia bacterium SbA2]